MAGHGAALGRGILFGASLALAYVAARETASFARNARREAGGVSAHRDSQPDSLVDWAWAERVAVRVAGKVPVLHPTTRAQLHADYRKLLAEIEVPLGEYTGTSLSLASTDVEVMDRPAWIRANLRSFRQLLAPIEELYRERAEEDAPGASITTQRSARLILSVELGLLLGYLSRRVLGQYDLNLLGDSSRPASLFFVEPNLQQVEHTLGVPGDEFRRWIALHEATHAYEFQLHPWVRDYLSTLVRTYLRLLTEDMRKAHGGEAVSAVLLRLADNLRKGHNLISALQTPRQREVLSRLQALMSLAEGYSNHVMNVVGGDLLSHHALIHERVEHRQRQRSRAEHLLLRMTGLSLKMEQYRRGEQFVDAVTEARGVAFANRAWECAENLPTEVEIAEPHQWIRRMEAATA